MTNMAAVIRLAILLGALVSAATPITYPVRNQNHELLDAIAEMQRANYFTFVTLINMVSLDQRIQTNVTFLMPNDRMLSRTLMPQGTVFDFLLRHSIPSPLLFDYLQHIPTGSIIPSSLPDYMLKISNNGRRNFSLNNVKIISPNICSAGSSIRCHGIDGVLSLIMMPENNNTSPPSPSCSNSSSPVAEAKAPAPSLPLPSTPIGELNPTPATAPTPTQPNARPHKSGSSPWLSHGGILKFFVTCAMVVIVGSI